MVERQWASSSNVCCKKSVQGTFSTKRLGENAADYRTRLLWTASVDFAKCVALNTSTLNRLVWDPRFSKLRVAGCKRHIGTWYTSNHLGVYSANSAVSQEHDQLSLLAVSSATLSRISCLWCQHGGRYAVVIVVSAVATSSSTRKRSSHRRARETCISAIHLYRCRAECCAVCIDTKA